MDGRKPVYLLAGGRPVNRRVNDLLIRAAFQESGTASPVVGYVGTANGDDAGFFSRMSGIFMENGATEVQHAVLTPAKADLTKAKDILKKADIIYIAGGDVHTGMRVLREKGMPRFLSGLYDAGKPFWGLSAGSIVLAKEWVYWKNPDDDATAEIFPCLGLAPVICDTHDEEGGWEELKALLKLERDGVRGYGIPTGTALKVFPDGRIEALGGPVSRYIRHGGEIERASDLLPASVSFRG